MKATTSVRVASSPAWQAAPNPRRGSWITRAPRRAAISAEPSSEPLSTTTGRDPGGIRPSTQGNAAASSSTGRTTSTTAPDGTARVLQTANASRPRRNRTPPRA
jgi:hypothetical protein